MFPRKAVSFFTALAMVMAGAANAQQKMREAPNPGATPVNQLAISGGNACGPASLLTAFRFGSENWRRAAEVPGRTEKERLWSVIRDRGLRPSRQLSGRLRWTRQGVNVPDLCDMANEMTRGLYLPQVREEIFFIQPKESQEKLLKRVHGRLEKSLDKGLPPVISLRRFVLRSHGGKPPIWTLVDGHFVTVIAVPRKLERHARSFPVTYIDPWGARRLEGEIRISDTAFLARRPEPGVPLDPSVSPCLEAVFPGTAVGMKHIRKREKTVLTVAAGVGRW